MVRTGKTSTKSSVKQVNSLLPVKDGLVTEPDESNPGEHSFIYSPSRRRTRGELCIRLPACLTIHLSLMVLTMRHVCVSAHRAEAPGPSEESAVPVTRSRRKVASVAPHVSSSVYAVF